MRGVCGVKPGRTQGESGTAVGSDRAIAAVGGTSLLNKLQVSSSAKSVGRKEKTLVFKRNLGFQSLSSPRIQYLKGLFHFK